MENKIKHLEMIQNVIERMARNSFALKGWTVGLSTALLTIACTVALNPSFYAVPFVPVLVFWFLDSYYLCQERLYRRLYGDVIQQNTEVNLFNLNARPYKKKWDFFKAFISKTESVFYGSLTGLLILITLCVNLIK